MSVEARITLTLEGGEWFATDEESGHTGHGATRAAALEHLDELLDLETGGREHSEAFADAIERGRADADADRTRSSEELRERYGAES